jgi:hypothetical protein
MTRINGKEGLPMEAVLRAFLDRMEFDAFETAVRYYEGNASLAELDKMKVRLEQAHALADSTLLAQRELFALPRRPAPPALPPGN